MLKYGVKADHPPKQVDLSKKTVGDSKYEELLGAQRLPADSVVRVMTNSHNATRRYEEYYGRS